MTTTAKGGTICHREMKKMGKMPRNEDRELLIESYEKTHDAEEIAKIFGVNKYTVYHCLKQSPVRFCASVNGVAVGWFKADGYCL